MTRVELEALKIAEPSLLELARENLRHARLNHARSVENMTDCLRNLLEQEAIVEKLEEEERGLVF